MKIAFYLEPWIELQSPKFRLGAFRNVVLKQAAILAQNGHEITLFVSDSILHYVEVEALNISMYNCIHIPQHALMQSASSYYAAAEQLYNNDASSDIVKKYASVFSGIIGEYTPDIIFSWESITTHLKSIYPDTLILHLMPGVFSRLPFPPLISFDSEGFFKDSLITKEFNKLVSKKTSNIENDALNLIREHYLNRYLTDYCPFKAEILQKTKRFKKTILIPLQVSGYFAFDENCEFKNQFDFLISALEIIPKDVGVIVTQYISPNTSDVAITKDNIHYLMSKYNNIVFDENYNHVDGISQYLMSLVDGVITVSSSIGLQALLWKKPVFVIGRSHLRALSHGSTTDEIYSALRNGYREELDAILLYVLTRSHIMSIDYLYKDNNLCDYIEKIHFRYVSGLRGIDLFEQVEDIEKYSKCIVAATNFKRAIVKLTTESKLSPTQIRNIKSHAKKMSLIRNSRHKIVSFDIFDTLLVRPYSKPVDLFKKISNEINNITNGLIVDFYKTRIDAETVLRKNILTSTSNIKEITLDDIYNEINKSQNNVLDKDTLSRMKAAEINEELSCLYPRESGLELYHEALRCGKKVIIISDMYLPEDVILEILKKNKIDGFDKLYLSSTIGLRKHDGDLYKFVIKDIKSKPQFILHIGDNSHGDITMAEKHGIVTLWTPRTMELFYKNKKNNTLFWKNRNSTSLSESISIAISANKLYDNPDSAFDNNSHFNGSEYNLGYYGLGWLFTAYTKWLIENAIKDDVKTLYFLSRDGEIMKQAYDKISPYYSNAPKSKYLYCSRRAARVAALSTIEDIKAICGTSFNSGKLSDFFKFKFNFNIDNVSIALLNEYKFNSPNDIVTKTDIIRIEEFAVSIRNELFDNSLKERTSYLSYLDEMGLTNDSSCAIVDIGYAGSMQNSLRDITKNNRLRGYYLMTFFEAKELHNSGSELSAFCGNFVKKEYSWHPICRLGLAFEVIFSSDSGSFVKMLHDSIGNHHPMCESTIHETAKKNLISKMRAGTFDFIDQVLKIFGQDISKIDFDNESCLSIYVDYLDNPSVSDTAIMYKINFDDNFAIAGDKYMIPPFNENCSLTELQRKS